MNADFQKECERLSHKQFLAEISQEQQVTSLIPVYKRPPFKESRISIHCAFIPNTLVEKALQTSSWEVRYPIGLPGAVEYRNGGDDKVVEYLRFGNNEGIEPLVINRNFNDIKPSGVEVSEEFRLFHNLYYEKTAGKFVKIDDAGNEIEIIVEEPNQILIRLKDIRQFMAVKEMHLALYFDNTEYSLQTLDDLGLKKNNEEIPSTPMTYSLSYGEMSGVSEWKSFSRLLGKRLIPPFPKEKSGFWGFGEEEPEGNADFIIGVNELGGNIFNTSCEEELSNYFGANPGEPHYLTPVFFRKTVLDKYYQMPEKYSVDDSILRCGSLWYLTMDNHHDDYVVVWLGDLGRDLPYEEQLYWKSFNIPPCGKVSDVFHRRQIDAQFADTDQPDLKLKYEFTRFQSKCIEKLGWTLFLPLTKDDEHYFNSLRIPASNGQKEFDDLVLGLAKVLVDSLNQAELMKFIPSNQHKGLNGGINRFEKALACQKAEQYDQHIRFLRELQEIRSCGSAHRKGDKYKVAAIKIAAETATLSEIFRDMLTRTLNLLAYLEGEIDNGLFDSSKHQTE